MPYHKGTGVKKSGPKGPRIVKGKVMEELLRQFDQHPSDPSHVISERVSEKTGVHVSPRTVRKIRHERGKTGSWRLSGRGAANAHTSHRTYS